MQEVDKIPIPIYWAFFNHNLTSNLLLDVLRLDKQAFAFPLIT
jgi:hypothetical protein